MKTFKELISELTMQQRMKRSRTSKRRAKITARKRKITLKKPPTQERIDKAVQRAVRKRALALADKSGIYRGASGGIKANIEKKADLKVQKFGSRWMKRLKPTVRKAMKDAYRTRLTQVKPDTSGTKAKDLKDE